MPDEIIPKTRGLTPDEIKGALELSTAPAVVPAVKKPEPTVAPTASPVYAVVDSGPGFLVIKTDKGQVEKTQGTISWRNNNPGNLVYGPLAKAHGAFGKDYKGFAVFKTYDDGKAAYHDLLFSPDSSYYNLNIEEMLNKYAPPSENNTKEYLNFVTRQAKLQWSARLSKLTADQQDALMNAMFKYEGFAEGKVSGQ